MKKIIIALAIVLAMQQVHAMQPDPTSTHFSQGQGQHDQNEGWRARIARYMPSWHYVPAIGAGLYHLGYQAGGYKLLNDLSWKVPYGSWQGSMANIGRYLGSKGMLAPILMGLGYAVKNRNYPYIAAAMAYLYPYIPDLILYFIDLSRNRDIYNILAKPGKYASSAGLILLGLGYLYDVYRAEKAKERATEEVTQ